MTHPPATTTGSTQLTLSDLRISTELWRSLSSDRQASEEVAEIVASPALHREAQMAASTLGRLAKGCGDESVRRALQPLVLVYGVSESARSPAFWGPYLAALRDLPADALAKAVEAYTQNPSAEFFPKPGPLKALGDKHATAIRRAAARARTAAAMAPPARVTPPTPEEREAVRKMLAGMRAGFAERQAAMRAKRPEPPSTAGAVDGTGLTREMRELRNIPDADDPIRSAGEGEAA